MKKIIALLFLIITLLFGNKDEYVYTETPYDDIEKIKRAFEPFLEYLSKESGIKITLKFARDYQDLIDRIAAGTVDIFYSSTNIYIEAKKRNPNIRVLATHTEIQKDTKKAMPYYHSVIAVKDSSPYKSLKDLKDKKFGFTDKESTSGYVYPNYIFKKEGIEPKKFFSNIFFLKKHDKVCDAIVSGAIDAGATFDGQVYSYNKTHKNALRVIAKSEPIPLEPFAINDTIPNDVALKIKDALLRLTPNHPVLQNLNSVLDWDIIGFVDSNDSFYDIARSVKKYIQ